MDRLYAVITNVCSEFGLKVCRDFAESGHDLLITSSSDEIFRIQSQLESEGYDVEAIRVDLGTHAGVENLYTVICDAPPIDKLIICSEDYGNELFLETSINEDIKQINHNIIAPLHLVKRVLPDMIRRQKGIVIFTNRDEDKKTSIQSPVQKATRAFLDKFSNEVELSPGVIIYTEYKNKEDHFFKRMHEYAYRVLPELKLFMKP